MNLNFPDFNSARVLVAGDVMLDRYWRGPSLRISPEAPVPVVRVEGQEDRPGGAANVAVNIASLGAQAKVLGVTGADANADLLAEKLQQQTVQSQFIRLGNHTTITKLRILSQHQQLLRLDFEDGFVALESEHMLSLLQAQLADVDIVVLSDYGKGALQQIQSCIQSARAAGKQVLVDPKGSDFTRYQGAHLITPNMHEFQAVVGACNNDQDIEEKGFALLHKLELEAILITRSEQGMTLLQADQPILHLPAKAREVYDVTGAGDTVIAVVAATLAAGHDLTVATALANQAAGLVVAKLGTASVTAEELQQSLLSRHQATLVSETELVQQVAKARALGEKIVMTNGCFDILHAGHVQYLEQASKLGDRLIVAVNDDATVRRLKGAERPVNSLADRMQMLAALKYVDWVVPFYEDTPERLICAVKPDILVKGGDNDPAKIPGNRCVWDAGGEVLVLDYRAGVSTTGIIRRIRAQTD